MDAIHHLSRNRIAAFFLILSFAAAPAMANGALRVNGAASANVALNGATLFATVDVTSTGDPIAYAASIAYTAGQPPWLQPIPDATTPKSIVIVMTNVPSVTPLQATITLTGGGSTATITVSFTPGPGGGGGTGAAISVQPQSISLQLAAAGSTQGTITVYSTDATLSAFTVTTETTTPGWTLFSSATAGTVSAGTPFVFEVSATTASSAPKTYTGSVTITPAAAAPITVPVSLAGGGSSPSDLTILHGGTNSTAITASASYGSSVGTLPADILVLPQSASGKLIYQVVSLTYQSGSDWLRTSGDPGQFSPPYNLFFGSAVTLGFENSVKSLAPGVYQATIGFGVPTEAQPIADVTATVVVTLYVDVAPPGVTVNPASWSLQVAAGGGSRSQDFAVTLGYATALTDVSTDTGWLGVSAVASDLTFTVTVDFTGLPPGVYNGNILVASDVPDSPLVVPVTLTVSPGGGSGAQIVAPSALNFAYQVGGPDVIPQTITIPGVGGTFQAEADQPWIVLDPPGAELPGSMIVRISTAGLAPRTAAYTGEITISTPNGLAIVPVRLLITTGRVIVANPGTLTFLQTGSGFEAQVLSLSASDLSPINPVVIAGPNAPWVQFTNKPDLVTNGRTLTVTVDASGMGTGTFGGSLLIVANGYDNSPLVYPVVLVTNGGGTGQEGPLTLSTSALTFNTTTTGAGPAGQTLSVTSNAGATSFTVSWTTNNGLPWLSVVPAGSLTTPQTLTVSVNKTGLTAGTYGATIAFTANGVLQQVPVTLVVGTSGAGGNVMADLTNLSFTYQTGAQAPAAQTVRISNATAGSAAIAYTASAATTSGGSWLKVTPTSGLTPSSLSISVTPAGLTPGSYNGTITVSPVGGNLVTVSVLLTVVAPAISVDTTDVSMTYRAGDSNPTRTVAVTGGANATFTAQASSAGGWLSVSPTSGTANPAILTITGDGASLAPGTTYQGTVTVTGSGGASGTAVINVSLRVLAPLPTITGIGNSASGYAASVSPGELISIYGTNIGPTASLQTQLDSTGKFVTTSLAGVQVLVSGYPAPLLYVSGTQVNAVVPYEIKNLRTVTIGVRFLDQVSNFPTLPVTPAAPGLFTYDSSGGGQVLAINAADGSLNGAAHPVAKGGWITVWVTGEGETVPAGVSGKVTVAQPSPPYTPAPAQPIAILVDNVPASTNFWGEAPGFVSGIMQVNVQIPTGVRSGDVPIVIRVGDYATQNPARTVTVRVQ